jgi:hypothetical protein
MDNPETLSTLTTGRRKKPQHNTENQTDEQHEPHIKAWD